MADEIITVTQDGATITAKVIDRQPLPKKGYRDVFICLECEKEVQFCEEICINCGNALNFGGQ